MAWPSWFPQSSRPGNWLDWSATFTKVVPREWPANLFGPESEGMGDLQAFGESLALARDMLQQIQSYLWPQKDTTDGVFLDRWESCFGIGKGSSSASERADRIVAAWRQRGTLTEDQAKAILCRAWGTDDPSVVQFKIATRSDVATAWSGITSADIAADSVLESSYIFCCTNVHVYHYDGTTPDYELLDHLISRIRPAFETWTGGSGDGVGGADPTLLWGSTADKDLWDRATWG